MDILPFDDDGAVLVGGKTIQLRRHSGRNVGPETVVILFPQHTGEVDT
jgi:hypothetical protein